MPPTVQPVTPKDVAHLHKWRWKNPPDGIYALWVQTRFVSCVHLFDLQVCPVDGGSPFSVCGMGGITTENLHRGNGHARMLLKQVIADHIQAPDGIEGFLLNGQSGEGLWYQLGFRDVGESLTAPPQRLWWLPRDGVELPEQFSLEPGDHW